MALKINREKISIKCGCDARQGWNLSPTLFAIVTKLDDIDYIGDLIGTKIELPSTKAYESMGNVLRFHDAKEMDKSLDKISAFLSTHVKGHCFLTL